MSNTVDATEANISQNVLAVDLDGSLIKTDLLYESFMLLIKQRLWMVFFVPFWLLKGKVYVKHQIAQHIDFDPEGIPFNQRVIDEIEQVKAQGRECVLVTGSVDTLAQKIADCIGLFDKVFASTLGEKNLTGHKKAQFLADTYGEKGFDYIGNSSVDLPVWEKSREAIVVSSDKRLYEKASQLTTASWFEMPKVNAKTVLKAIRIHQWVKNVLLFVPLLTSHQVLHWDLLWHCLLGFVAFSLAASSVYVLNDLMDLASDRQHATKKRRPFASGALSIKFGVFLFPLLLAGSALICLLLPLPFFYALLVYYAITVFYSFSFKQIMLLDVITLAVLYTMRIIAGVVLIEVPFSPWLLAFSIFIFLSLALVKRYVELVKLALSGKEKTAGRGYVASDSPIIAALGCAAGFIGVLVLALYVNSSQVVELYAHEEFLWVACVILLYWISRMWLLAHRGEMDDDPIFFAIKDKASLITAVLVFAVFVMAI
ncbi:MAG: UbiA family prenyltransferase [Cellvibrionales bacterium]|nr:UbiA family prenyltransferase [Cellvibrionales bacterium]